MKRFILGPALLVIPHVHGQAENYHLLQTKLDHISVWAKFVSLIHLLFQRSIL